MDVHGHSSYMIPRILKRRPQPASESLGGQLSVHENVTSKQFHPFASGIMQISSSRLRMVEVSGGSAFNVKVNQHAGDLSERRCKIVSNTSKPGGQER